MRHRRTGTTADGPGRGRSAELLASVRPVARIPTCGHPDRKHGGKGLCHSCYMGQWLKAHPDANSGNGWARLHPEEHRVLKRRQQLKRKGITQEDYDRLWIEQNGQCANPACDFTAPLVMLDYRQGLQVDHDHKTGQVRRLLCSPCNRALGLVDDDPSLLAGLIEYLLGLN